MSDNIVPLERFHEARQVLDGRIDCTPILSSSSAARVLAARGEGPVEWSRRRVRAAAAGRHMGHAHDPADFSLP